MPKAKKGISLEAFDEGSGGAMKRWRSGEGVLVGATAPVLARKLTSVQS